MARGRRAGAIGTSEARAKLPTLVREVISDEASAGSLRENAIEIRPRGEQRSVLLVASEDADAMESRVEQLEEELENAGIALYLQERLAKGDGGRLDAAAFLTGIGMDEFIDELPGR